MKRKTHDALKSSIAHWRRMALGKSKSLEYPTSDKCKLCDLFENDRCRGCPVLERTGLDSCEFTPYREAYLAFRKHGIYSNEFKQAASEELKFLQSLLPNKKGKQSPCHISQS